MTKKKRISKILQAKQVLWYWCLESFFRFIYESDGTNFVLHFGNGQPNDFDGQQDCVYYSPKTITQYLGLYPFNDFQCHFDDWASFVCQAPLLPCYQAVQCQMSQAFSYPPSQCQAGYQQVKDQCYKLHPENKTYDVAQQTCVSEGATLIEPRSQADLNLLDSEWGHLGKMYE